ncbi:MAG: carboxylesterase family protein [Candidatus Helarchaeota archaeon]
MKRWLNVKNVSYSAIILNLASIILGLIYLITISNYTIIWDVFGIIYLITLFTNFVLVYIDSRQLNKTTKIGNQISLLGYFYLALTIVANLLIFLGNFLYSATYSPELNANLGNFLLIYGSFFGLLVFGFLIAYLNIKNLHNSIWDSTARKISSRKMGIIKIILMGICYIGLIVGIYFAAITLFGANLGHISGSIGIFVSQFDLFFVFITLSFTILLLKLKDWRHSTRSYYGVMVVGLVLTSIFMAPLCATPFAVASADRNFTEAFGNNWRDDIPSVIETQYFLQTQFSIPEYFLGKVTTNYVVNANILFYDAEGIQLYFDAYLPKQDGSTLPGNNSVLIRIHGGGWTEGDKGLPNMMQMNKYFAAQGYIVFDIQYGLAASGLILLPTPGNVIGNFTVDDMVRHIGNFTQYLIAHADEFGANLDSVFVSGGSAGGHLTCAVGLGIASGNYTALFGGNLTIKGIIPFYPANGHPAYLGGSTEFINPDDYLVNVSSPPCLIFQGLQDGLVHPSISQDLKNAYTAAGNPDCAIIYLPFGGHAADLYFTGYYNLPFLYYMERFMYLCNIGVIGS